MTTPSAEMSVRELRADLADVINAAGTRDQVTFVTSRGRRVAAVVSVAADEQAAGEDGPAEADARHRDDVRGQPRDARRIGRHPERDPGRAVRGVRRRPAARARRQWRPGPGRRARGRRRADRQDRVPDAVAAGRACRRAVPRAAEITGQELPGSYRPGSRAGSAARR